MHRRLALTVSALGFVAISGLVGLVSLLAPVGQAAGSSAQNHVIRSATAAEQAEVQVLVETISGVNLATATYDATFYLGLRCSVTCRSTRWEIVNATQENQALVTEADGWTWWKVSATMLFSPDLRTYPFDTQVLPIAIESTAQDVNSVQFQVNPQGLSTKLAAPIPGWSMGQPTSNTSISEYPMLDEKYSQVRFEIPIHRNFLASILTYFVPLSAFIVLGVAVLALERSDYHIRVAGTALVGLTVFYLATSGRVTSTDYLTVWDLCIALGYISLSSVLIGGIIGARLYQKGRYEGDEGRAFEGKVRFRFFLLATMIVLVGGLGVVAYALT